jgi:hypothetical protein
MVSVMFFVDYMLDPAINMKEHKKACKALWNKNAEKDVKIRIALLYCTARCMDFAVDTLEPAPMVPPVVPSVASPKTPPVAPQVHVPLASGSDLENEPVYHTPLHEMLPVPLDKLPLSPNML